MAKNENSYSAKRDSALVNLRAGQEVDPDHDGDVEGEEIADTALEGLYAEAFDEDLVEDLEPEVKLEPVQLHKIKVNGVEKEITYEELLRKAQLVESAEEYQRQAKVSYDLAQQKLNTQLSRDVEDNDSEEAELAEIAAAIQMGDTEEAVRALKKLRSTNKPSLSTDDVTRAVEQKLQFQKAGEQFRAEYPELFEDQVLYNLVVAEDNKLVAQNDPRDYIDRYRDIGNRVREWKDEMVTKSGGKASSLAAKKERKDAAPSYPARKASAPVVDNDDEAYEGGEPSLTQRNASLAAKAKARGQVFVPRTN